MKRSETIGLIQTVIEGHSNDPDANWGDGTQCAERVLDALERAGMLPASYEGCMRDGKKYVRELHGHYDTMLVRNRWEPEDVLL